jgi:hypothetical protein
MNEFKKINNFSPIVDRTALGYGLKFWPEEFQRLQSANPHIAIFSEEGML